MAKKPVPEVTPPGLNMIRLGLDNDRHEAMRMLAAKYRMSVAALTRWIVNEYVDANAKPKGPTP